MHRRFSRWVSFFAIGAGSALLISCGGNGGNGAGKAYDASVDAPGFGNINLDAGSKCKAKTCKDYPSATCGKQSAKHDYRPFVPYSFPAILHVLSARRGGGPADRVCGFKSRFSPLVARRRDSAA